MLLRRLFLPLFLLSAGAAVTPAALAQFVPQGNKLVGTGYSRANNIVPVNQGISVALSADGNTLLVGGPGDNGGIGASWVYTSTNGSWTQQGAKLLASDAVSTAGQGWSVALSADGNTALVGGAGDNGGIGAAWVYTRSNGVWSQQALKLVGTGATLSTPEQGYSVALSADGNTALIGAPGDSNIGASWVFTRSNGAWTQQGPKLAGASAGNAQYPALQGYAVALSGDGNTAMVGAAGDAESLGAVWIFARTNGVWSVQGGKLVGNDSAGTTVTQGCSVALSFDGNTALFGGRWDNNSVGAAWVFARSGGAWTQQGAKLAPSDGLGGFGTGLALSADGNTAFIGGPYDSSTYLNGGAAWAFKRTSGAWSQQGAKLSAADAGTMSTLGFSVALSGDGSTAVAGGPGDSSSLGAAWVFTQPVATHFAVSPPATATAGTAINLTVTAQDANNNTVSGYTGTVHFTSSDLAAVLPADAALTNGTATFQVTLKTAGNQTITAADAVLSSIAGSSSAIAVAAGTATQLAVSAPGSAIPGVAFNFTVTAKDALNNTVAGYSGTLHFSTTDAAGVVPANAALTGGTGTFSATLSTNGNQYITAADTVTQTITGTSGAIALGAPATHMAVSAPAAAIPGTAFNFTVTALDANNNVSPSYAGTVHFSSTDLAAVLPADAALIHGTATFQATLKTQGSQTITAADATTSSIKGTSGTILLAGPATHFSVSASSSATAGTAVNVTVTALDSGNNTSMGYTGTVHFSSSDPNAVLPANATLTSGTGTFPVILKTAGNQFLTATDTVTAGITGNSGTVVVAVGAVTHLSVSAPATATAGTAFNITVAAKDGYENTVPSYTGAVKFTTTDAAGVLPGISALTNGTGTFSATLKTGGNQSITATDTVTSSFTGSSGAIAVSGGAATHFVLSPPASATAGVSFNLTLTAQDVYNNTSTGYTGIVRFSSSDGSAVLPPNVTLTNGTGGVSATLKTAGNQTITATDTVTASITGSTANVPVAFGTLMRLMVSAPATAAAGTAFNFTVTAQDAFNNTVTTYPGTLHFSGTDTSGVLPANTTLPNGAGTFPATFKTLGPQAITVTDTVTATITGTSGTITVTGGPATHLVVLAPAAATAGTPINFTVTAEDAFNNTSLGYSGTVRFSSSDAAAALPANATLTNGTGAFPATLKTPGNQTVTATDTTAASITGVSGTVAVAVGGTTHLAVTAPATATAGATVAVTVTAQDGGNNTVTSYSGTVHFSSTDGSAILPANAMLAAGTASFNVAFKTSGAQTVTATDTTTASILGVSGTVTVAAAALAGFGVTAPATATAGTAFNFTVTAQDTYGNTVPGYTNFVHFSSSDSAAVLPANSMLTNGTGTLPATLKSPGAQTITAADITKTSITGVSATITVAGAAATHFVVSAAGTATAGKSLTFTVTAQDANNNISAGYSGTVHFGSSDAAAVLPANSTLTNGTATFPVTFKTAGNQTVAATDSVTASITGTSGAIAVAAGTAAALAVSAPATAVAGTAANFTVTAQDAWHNTTTGYTGTVHFNSSDGSAVLPADAGLTNGAATFAVTLKTAGNQTLTATDTATAAITGVSGTIAVAGGAAAHLVVSAPGSANVGTAFNVTVTAQDAYNNTSAAYAGTIRFSSSDGAAVLPANAPLTNGTGTFPATLKTMGSQTIAAADTATASVSGASATITVGTGGATHFAVSAPASATPGTSFNFTVTAQDAGNNTVTGYTGTVHFSSSDTTAVLPANATLTNGTGAFPAILKATGNQTVTATDAATASIKGTSGAIAVSTGVATHLAVSAPASAIAGTSFVLTVTAQDDGNNTVASYAGTIHFNCSDATAVLPANTTLMNGTATFSAILKSAGSRSIAAADTATASISGSSGAIAVAGGAVTHFAFSAPTSVSQATPFNFTVTAIDAYNNISTGYAGTIHFTSSDAVAVLPADGPLTNGMGAFSATLKTAGNQSITIADSVTATITGTTGAISVSGGTAAVSAAPGSGAGTGVSMTFTFTDPRGWQDLDVVNILFNDFLDGRNACYLAYSRPYSMLYLVNDPGTALLPPLALSGSGTTGNSQCTVTGSGSSAVGNGNTLTLTLNMTFTAGFAGNKVSYLAARDLLGGNSGWQALGTWQVPGGSATGPQVTGVAPARSSGTGAQTFTFTFVDTNGAQDLGVVNVLVNDALNGNQACYLAYSRADNTLHLVNDAGNALLAGLVLNGSGTLGNSQCTVTGAGSSASGSGTTLTLTLNLSFTPAFAGNRVIYMAARSNGDVLNSGWQSAGSRTVTVQ